MEKNICWLALGLLVTFFTTSCGTSKLVKPMEKYDETVEDQVSTLNIPVRISIPGLERTINRQLSGVIYEDNDIDDGDKMMIRAEKKEDIKLSVDSQLVKYRVPLSLWIRYDAGIAKVEANGVIALQFKTGFSIRSDWAMETKTELENYEWLETPKVRLGMVSLPVGFIANIVLSRSREVLAQSIDDQIRQNFNLQEMITDTWKQVHDPLLISEEYNSWLIMNPRDIGMTPLLVEEDTISSTIMIESRPEIRLGQRPVIAQGQLLPTFQERAGGSDDFNLHIRTDIPYEEAERLTRDQIVGETYDYGKRSFTVEDVEMYGQGELLIVNVKLSGSYTGDIYLQGRPYYNVRRNAIEIDDLKFTPETRNFLAKSALWLLRSPIKKRMVETLNFYLDYNLEEIQEQIRAQMANYELAQGIVLNGDLEELSIQNAFLAPEGIKVDIGLKGKAQVKISGIMESE